MNIYWFFGPKESVWNGVGQYSKLLVEELNSTYDMNISQKYIPYTTRSLKRYFYQFFIYPFLLFKNRDDYKLVVLYQEDLAFLIPFARLLNKKVFVIYHHLPTQSESETFFENIKLFYLKITSRFIALADKIICPSQQSVDAVSSALNINKNNFSVVYNSFDNDDFSVVQNKNLLFRRLGIDIKDNEKILLNVGSDETRKNLQVLVESLVLIRGVNVHLIRVGKSIVEENKRMMQSVIRENNIRVSFVDFVSDEDLKALYSSVDLYVSPSVHEGFGRTVIEAQFSGLPVIASKIPVYDEIMGISYFPVTNYNNPVDWAKSIESIIFNDNKLSLVGIENAKRFTKKNVTIQFFSLLKDFS